MVKESSLNFNLKLVKESSSLNRAHEHLSLNNLYPGRKESIPLQGGEQGKGRWRQPGLQTGVVTVGA